MTVVAAFLCIRPDLPIQSAKEHGCGRGMAGEIFFAEIMVTWLEHKLWKENYCILVCCKMRKIEPCHVCLLEFLEGCWFLGGSLWWIISVNNISYLIPIVIFSLERYSFNTDIQAKTKQKREMIQFKVGFFTMCSQEFNLYIYIFKLAPDDMWMLVLFSNQYRIGTVPSQSPGNQESRTQGTRQKRTHLKSISMMSN